MTPNLYVFAIANLIGLALCLPLVQAQPTPSLSPAQLQAFENLADQVKAALERGDLDADLMVGIFKQRQALEPTPQEKYANLQQSAPSSGPEKFFALERLAKAAYNAGDLNGAEQYARELLTGSPTLNSFGPNMSLAKELLAAGERDTVLEFFNLCRAFWKMQHGKLDDWTAMVMGGGTPQFGANLLY